MTKPLRALPGPISTMVSTPQLRPGGGWCPPCRRRSAPDCSSRAGMVSSRPHLPAQAVEEHGDAHRAEGGLLELLPQGVAGGGEEGGVEGPADLQGQAALGAQLLGQCGGLVHGGLLAADDQLAGAVVVGDLHHARAGGLTGMPPGSFSRSRPSTAVMPQGRPGRGCGHGLAPEGGQGDSLGSGEHPGALEGGVLAQGEARGVVRDECPAPPAGRSCRRRRPP